MPRGGLGSPPDPPLHQLSTHHNQPRRAQPLSASPPDRPLHSPAPDAAAVSPSDQVVLQVLMPRFHPWSADTKRRPGCLSFVIHPESDAYLMGGSVRNLWLPVR
ncbi:hypothetical protein AAHA92_09842 [Salvia divinorum]|uniref:Uncharacterized protein n=1 Tax=Salvia divinorum TaxID=28513 RepID=A0ABD1HSQ9_SALDI